MNKLDEFKAKAKAEPKVFYRDEAASWNLKCEGFALKCEHEAFEAYGRNDDATGDRLRAEATEWRTLLRNN
jgi:hypothetical protein